MAVITFNGTEISDLLNNPYTGWAPWAEYGPYPQPHRLVYTGIYWSELEPRKGTYDWNAVETKYKFAYWTERNIQFVLRIIMDYPGSPDHKDIPEWLYQEINREGTWYNRGFSPNYKNTALIANHQRLMNAFGQRYNNDPRIAFVQLGSLGHWGELHTVYLKSTDQGFMPNVSVSDQYVRHYLNALPNKKLLMRRPFEIAKQNNMGLYNDMFGDPTETQRFIRNFTSGYTADGNWGIPAGTYPAMPDFWRYAPSGGEMPQLSAISNANIRQTIGFAEASHTSMLGPGCPAKEPIGSALQDNSDALRIRMGYRFILQSTAIEQNLQTGSTVPVTMAWNNKGVAPFYYRWPLELSFADSGGTIDAKIIVDEDIRTWLPGTKTVTKSITIPSNLTPGTYTLCVAILDPNTGVPGIDLAMTGRRSDGRYSLGQVNVAGTSPLVISNIRTTSITQNSAVITWTTNRPSDSQVEYGLTTAYGSSTPVNTALVTSHSVQLTGLTPASIYNYRVKSKEAQGSQVVSGNNSFSTLAPPPKFIIDGNASDWADIGISAEPSAVSSLKISNDTTALYFCVQGKGLNVKSSIYINTDNNTTGYTVPGWNASGCDYLLENNVLFRYTGTGTNWSWSQVGTMEFARNDQVVETAIPLSLLSLALGRTIRAGYVLSDSDDLRLPGPGQSLPAYTLK